MKLDDKRFKTWLRLVHEHQSQVKCTCCNITFRSMKSDVICHSQSQRHIKSALNMSHSTIFFQSESTKQQDQIKKLQESIVFQ